jgi:uncharacterized protein (TIGR03067 family)
MTMFMNLTAALAAGLLAAPVPKDDPTKATDKDRLQGTWVVVSAENDGKPHNDPVGDRLEFSGETVFARHKEGKPQKATFKLDPSKKPKAMDVVHQGETEPFRLIYLLDGDVLKLCGPNDPGPGGKRPTEFTAKAGSRQVVMVLKRQKK